MADARHPAEAQQLATGDWLLAAFAALACPQVGCPNGPIGTGVVVAVRDDFAYVLTAAHVVPFDGVEVQFRPGNPKAEWFAESPQVLKRWPDPDVALLRFKVGKRPVPVLVLAGANDRPKAFPAAARSFGYGGGVAAVWADTLRAKRFVRRPAGVAFFWEAERPPVPGRSGGPLLDDRGRVIGICSATQDGRGYYAHTDEILAALARDGFGWLVPKP